MQIDFSRSIVDIVLDHGNSVPDRPALIFDQGDGPQSSLTYAQVAAQVGQLAGAMAARGLAAGGVAAGGLAGPRIALLFSAGTDFALALLACLAVGGVAIPLAPVGRRKARLRNILNMLDDIRPDCILLDDGMAGLFGEELSAALSLLNTFAVVYMLPSFLRTFCLHFISSNMHYYGDVEARNVMQQCQVLNPWWLLPMQVFCFNFGSTHAIHHFLVKEPFYIRQMTAAEVKPVMKAMGIRFNDFGTFVRANRLSAAA